MFYPTLQVARADAARQELREKVVCFVLDGARLLVFDHLDVPQAGVQVPAGGVEPGETPAEAACRELREESGLSLDDPQFLVSYLWETQLPERFTRQVCHAFAFAAPLEFPASWTHPADGHIFEFRWADLAAPGLDWELDAALPHLPPHLAPSRALEPAHD